MVALPKRWVRELGLGQGAEVVITKLNSTSLVVSAQPDVSPGASEEALIELDLEDSVQLVFRKVVSLYVLGFSRMVVEGTGGHLSASKKAVLKDLIRRHLIGTEGVVESRDRMTVHVLLGYSELSVEAALRKMLLIIDSLGKDASSAIRDKTEAAQDTTSERQEEVGRFCLYVIRQLNLSLSQGVLPDLRLENRDTLGFILVARMLERITHHIVRQRRAVDEMEGVMEGQLADKLGLMNESACALVDESMLALFKRDYDGSNAAVERANQFVESEVELTRLLEARDFHSYYALHSLVDAQRRIAEYAREIAEVVLDMTVERTLMRRDATLKQAQYA